MTYAYEGYLLPWLGRITALRADGRLTKRQVAMKLLATDERLRELMARRRIWTAPDVAISCLIAAIEGRTGIYIADPPNLYRQWSRARAEHVWLLRAEGLKQRVIAARIGVSKSRVQQIIARQGRRVARAMRHTRITIT